MLRIRRQSTATVPCWCSGGWPAGRPAAGPAAVQRQGMRAMTWPCISSVMRLHRMERRDGMGQCNTGRMHMQSSAGSTSEGPLKGQRREGAAHPLVQRFRPSAPAFHGAADGRMTGSPLEQFSAAVRRAGGHSPPLAAICVDFIASMQRLSGVGQRRSHKDARERRWLRRRVMTAGYRGNAASCARLQANQRAAILRSECSPPQPGCCACCAPFKVCSREAASCAVHTCRGMSADSEHQPPGSCPQFSYKFKGLLLWCILQHASAHDGVAPGVEGAGATAKPAADASPRTQKPTIRNYPTHRHTFQGQSAGEPAPLQPSRQPRLRRLTFRSSQRSATSQQLLMVSMPG